MRQMENCGPPEVKWKKPRMKRRVWAEIVLVFVTGQKWTARVRRRDKK